MSKFLKAVVKDVQVTHLMCQMESLKTVRDNVAKQIAVAKTKYAEVEQECRALQNHLDEHHRYWDLLVAPTQELVDKTTISPHPFRDILVHAIQSCHSQIMCWTNDLQKQKKNLSDLSDKIEELERTHAGLVEKIKRARE